jgi:ring-1,2-phenylacetyl-CoA epoxidase subunit PaaD
LKKENQDILSILSRVHDPEIPVLSIVDLGILREINVQEEEIEVCLSPTYSGCPAMDIIRSEVKRTLAEHGYKKIRVTESLSPAWTTDWMTEVGKEKLRAYGIAPPRGESSCGSANFFQPSEKILCPHCQSTDTQMVSQFGSTPCKALYRCLSCLEPFDYFKCH